MHTFSAPGDILFEEEFNNNGDYNSDWSDSGSGDASVTSETFSSASNALRIGEDTHTVTSDSGRIDTSGIGGADLTVWIRRGDDSFSEDPDSGEDLVFEYLNNSGSWIELDTYLGSGTDGEIYTPTFSLPADALYNNLRLRFRYLTGSGNNFDYWHIDDVVITETGSAAACDTYEDTFSSSSYTNSDGSLDWTSDSWMETNDNSSASSGTIEISGGQLELSGNNSLSNAAITRQADTNGATQITLSFDFEMLGGIETVDSALLEISANGGSSWTTLETFVGFNNGDSGSRSYDVTAYASSNMQIRFAISPDDNSSSCCFGTGGERMEIDDLVIESCVTDVPDPVAWYRLDEENWSGASGEVIDSSASGFSGEAVNDNGFPDTDDASPAIAGDPGTCGYGEFDGTADGYLQIPAPGSTLDFSSNFSVAVWIYPYSLPSSDLMTIVSKDENFEFHLTTSGTVNWWWGGGGRSLTSSSTVTLNTWNHIAITYESGNQVIYINGVSAGTNNSAAALTLNNDDLFIGTDIAFHSRRFNGRIDEVKIYDETLDAAQVDAVMTETHDCPVQTTTHYFIDHPGDAVTCEAATVNVIAHDGSHTPVPVAGNTIQITATSSTPGWSAADTSWALESGTGSFSSPSPGVAEYTFGSGESAVALSFANTSVADIDFDVVDLGDPSLTDIEGDLVEDEILSFADTGFLFYDDSDANGDRDPDGLGGFEGIQSELLSGATSTQMILRAVQTNDETGACEARVTGLQTVSMGYECVNPISCTNDADYALISGAPAGRNDLGNNGNLNGVNLTFDGDGEAPFTLEYRDAGQIRLIAQLALAADPISGDPAITLFGTSDNTTAAPAAFVITSVNDGSGNEADGTSFITSESTFEIEVEAQNADGDPTPNFGNEIDPERIRLSIQSVDMPPGGISGTLSYNLSNSGGIWTSPASSWNEAGTFTLLADLDDSDGDSVYMGTSLGILSDTRANVGRFYPASFDLLAGGTVANGCAAGGFTYMSDQIPSYFPIDLAINIAPLGSSGGNLNNYQSGYTPLASFALVVENNNSGVDLSSRANLQGGAWVADGVSGDVDYRFAASDDAAFRRALTGLNETVDGPYASLQLGLVADGTDSIDFIAADLTMRADQSNDCVTDGDCNAAAIGSPLNVVFGRLYGSDAHGPESAALAVPMEVQFWDGNEFVTQTNDSCTIIAVSDIEFDGSDLSADANRTVTIGGGTTTGTFSNYTLGSDFTFASGDAGLSFSAPGPGNTGQFNVDIDLANYPWLRNDWDNNGDYANDTAVPSLEIEFGRYRGHDRIIYWEEILD